MAIGVNAYMFTDQMSETLLVELARRFLVRLVCVKRGKHAAVRAVQRAFAIDVIPKPTTPVTEMQWGGSPTGKVESIVRTTSPGRDSTRSPWTVGDVTVLRILSYVACIQDVTPHGDGQRSGRPR